MGHRAGTSANVRALAPPGPLLSHQAAGARCIEACGLLEFHLCMRSYAQPKGALPASEVYGKLACCRLRGHSCLWLQLPGESDPQDSGPVQWRGHSCSVLHRNPSRSFCLTKRDISLCVLQGHRSGCSASLLPFCTQISLTKMVPHLPEHVCM